MRDLKARGEALLSALNTVLSRKSWSAAEIRQHQLGTLQSLAAYAEDEIPLYQRRFREAGFDRSGLRSLEDLERIPLLRKEDLRRAALADLRSPRDDSEAVLLSSSGSSGIPARLYRSQESLWRFAAYNIYLYHEWCRDWLGSKPLENGLYFIDRTPQSIDLALAEMLLTTVMPERIVSVAESASRMCDAVEELAPEFLSSYPSALRSIATELVRRGRSCPEVKLIHLTSEMLDPHARRLFGRVFPKARLVETYTSSEGGLLGFQCLRENRWHLTEDGAIFEILDPEGKPVAPGRTGQLVITDLTNRATPILRYQGLSDHCSWELSRCSCGSPLRSIRQLEGRTSELLLKTDGSWISPFVLIDQIEDIPGILQFQLVQKTTRDFDVSLLNEGGAGQEELKRAVSAAFASVLPGSAPEIRFVQEIAAKGRHKVPVVISELRSPQ